MLGSGLSTESVVLLFLAAAAAIGLAGSFMAGLADRLADRTGMGEALMGALFLGVSTSLPSITATVTAALDGHAALAVSNAMGGIAVQATFLAVADLFHRGANLEHAAASVSNMVQATLLVALLATVILAMLGPAATVAHVHPVSLLLPVAYLLGMRLAWRSSTTPMWRPTRTEQTVEDRPDPGAGDTGLGLLWLGFAGCAAVVLVAGVAVGRAAGLIASRTGLHESTVGGVFLAIATSLPELVTTIAAVRRGALTLAVSDIVGGNAFDVLFVCVADAFWLRGSVYQAAGPRAAFLAALAVLINVVLLMGLLQRERRGPGNIGFESVLMVAIYAAGMLVLGFGL